MLRQAFRAVNLAIPDDRFYDENPGMMIFGFSFVKVDIVLIDKGRTRLGLGVGVVI